METTRNITVYRGVDFVETYTLTEDSVAVNLTGWSVKAHVRRTASGPLVFDIAPTITTAVSGIVTIDISATNTRSLDVGTYYWDMIFNNGSDWFGPWITGTFTVSDPITQSA